MQPESNTLTTVAQEPDIVVEDESWKHGFTQVPNVILRNRSLSLGAKLAYSVLLSYAWQNHSCFPGQARMAVDLGCIEKTVRTYLHELEESGVIVVKRRGQGKTNLYRLPRLIGDPREP
jgi:biotin operon repressor